MANEKEEKKDKFDVHCEVMESARKWINSIARENLFSDMQVFKEDLKDGKVTFRFSFTPAK